MRVGTLEIQMQADIARLAKDMDQAKRTVDGAMQRIEKSVNSAKDVLSALGIGISGGMFLGFVKSSIDAADSVNDLTQRIGASVSEIAKYELATGQSGTTTDALARGLKALGSNLEEHTDALGAAGITARTADGALRQVADVFASMPDGIEKTNLATELFGKSGAELIPMLNMGSAGLGEAAEKSEEYAAALAVLAPQADAFNDNLAELVISSKAIGYSILNDAMPGLVSITGAMAVAAKESGLLQAAWVGLGGIGWEYIFKPAAVIIKGVTNDLEELNVKMLRFFGQEQEAQKVEAQIARRWKEIADMTSESTPSTPSASPSLDTEKWIADYKKLMAALSSGKDKAGSGAAKKDKEYEAAMKSAQEMAKLRNDEYESINKYLQAEEAARVASVKAANDAVKAAQDEYDQFGLTRSQIEEITLARMRDKLAGVDSSSAIAQSLEQEIAAQEKLIGIMRKGEDRDAKIKEQEKQAAESQKIWDNFTENVQRNMGDGLYDAMNGNFKNIGDSFKSMIQRMLADAAAANIMKMFSGGGSGGGAGGILSSIVGGIGAIAGGWGSWGAANAGFAASNGMSLGELAASFDGGGFTGNGPRSGGIDGIGGFPAILHPQETVIDHSKGQSAPSNTVQVTYAPTIQIDSRTDQAEVRSIVDRAVKNGNAQLVDQLQRAGRI